MPRMKKGYRVVMDNLPLVCWLVHRHERGKPDLARIDFDDRTQEALLRCLMRASRYNRSRAGLGVYLGWSVKQAMGSLMHAGRRMRQPIQEFLSLEELAAHTIDGGRGMALPAPALPCSVEAADSAQHARQVLEEALAALPWQQAWAIRLVKLHGLSHSEARLMMGASKRHIRYLIDEGMEGMRGVVRAREEAA